MADLTTLAEVNLLLRGGVVMLLLLIAGGLLRDQPKAVAARLGALFAVGVAAYAVCCTPGFHARAGLASAPFLALAVGNNLVFWMFARALFSEGFQPRPVHGVIWAVVAIVGISATLGWLPPDLERVAGIALSLQALGFALLATVQTVRSWASDLVEPRRRLRVFIVAASAGHIALTAAAGLSPRLDMAPVIRLADAMALGLIAAIVAWSVLRVSSSGLFGVAAVPARAPEPANLDAAAAGLLRRLDHEMGHERAYRDETLSIGRLAHRLGAPEYRLRRAINQGLGHRNFAAYLNGHRIAEARTALADPSQGEVPILTIALDAGFGSLGPFNRAFKADTGVTPSEYRRAALGQDTAPAQATAA